MIPIIKPELNDDVAIKKALLDGDITTYDALALIMKKVKEVEEKVDEGGGGGNSNLEYVEEDNFIKATIEEEEYAIESVSKLVAPAVPTGSADGSNTSASRVVTLSCSTEGAKIVYTTNGDTPTKTSTAYTGPITANASTDAASTPLTIKAIAVKNGKVSASAVEVDATTARHLPTPSVEANGNEFSTSRSVTLSCSVAGVTFKDASGNTITSPDSISATKIYSVKAVKEGWQDSGFSTSKTIEVGIPKTYYGFLTGDTISTSTQITSLTPLEKKGLQTGTAYSITASAAGYLWVCQYNTLTPAKIYNDSTYSSQTGMETKTKVGSWNVYRSINKVAAGTYTLYLKP